MMELLQLKYFCDAAKSENFSKTAQKFTIPPSAVSQSIRRLETELGTTLFDRHANRIILNEKGRIFYAKVSDALLLLREGELAVQEADSVQELSICVNCNRRIVMRAAEEFKKTHQAAKLRIVHLSDPLEEEFDLIITSDLSALSDKQAKKLLSEQMALAVPVSLSHILSEPFNLASLAEAPFVTLRSGTNLYTLTERICHDAGFSPRIAIETDDPFYLRRCVETGLGIAFVPLISWQGQFDKSVILYPLQEYVRETYVCTSRSKPLPSFAKEFLSYLFAQCEALK